MTDKIAVDRDFLEHAVVALEYAYSADDEMVQESIKYLRAALRAEQPVAAQPAEHIRVLREALDVATNWLSDDRHPIGWTADRLRAALEATK